MRSAVRYLVGVTVGLGAVTAYLWVVGVDQLLQRVSAVAPATVALVAVFVIAEGISDGLGVWASVEPLGDGLSGLQSVQFALAGDFFDTVSPAGPVSSEPIVAKFVSGATGTTYSEALGVRTAAKYVKSGSQLLVSTVLALVLLVDRPGARTVLLVLCGALVGFAILGVLLVWSRRGISRVFATGLGPIVRRVSGLYRDEPHDRSTVVAALDRFWDRTLGFRQRPTLLVLIAGAAVLEQVLTAAAIWTALGGFGTPTPLLVLVVVVPLPQVASAVPIPGSIGAYDLLLGGAIVVATGVSAAAAAAAVLVVRTLSLPFRLSVGGLAVSLLDGWRFRPSEAT